MLGSVRSDRMGERVARWVVRQLQARGHEPLLVDPAELKLPILDRMWKEVRNAPPPHSELYTSLKSLADLYGRADGFCIVSGEYNHSIPPALSNLLDYFLEEYFWRPSAIVCYSATPFGGVRAAMQLRAMLAELGMPSIPSIQPIPAVGSALTSDGLALTQHLAERTERFFDEFEWYMRAFQTERRKGVPY